MAKQTLQTTRFGKYHLLKLLTYGSVAEILLAFKVNKHHCKKLYVIKKLLGHLATDEDKLQGFIKEGEIATSLSHQNIVHGHEYDAVELAEETFYYLAMDYVFGKNLAQVKRRSHDSALPVNIVSSIIHSVASGLMHAHTYCDPLTLQEQSIVHKDISPDNIIISYRGEVKISDFGISRLGHVDNLSGKIAGKWSYMSPEQRQSKDLDCRSDIYSLGVVFWECLTGKKVFANLNMRKKKHMAPSPDVVHPCEVNTDIPMLVGDICMKCLELEPDNRFQSAKALCDALFECSNVGQPNTASLKKFMLQHFAEDFKNEARQLLQAQKASLTQNASRRSLSPQQTTAKTKISKTISSTVLTEDACLSTSVAEAPLVLFPDINPLKNIEDVDKAADKKTSYLEPLDHNSQRLSAEKTVTVEPIVDDAEQTTEIARTSLDISAQDLWQFTDTTMFGTDALLQNSSLNVLVNSENVTQTDYEITVAVSSVNKEHL